MRQVQPEQQPDGTVVYSASNPDEGALIYAASHFGHRFLRRDGRDVVVAVTIRREQPAASLSGSGSTSARDGGSASTPTPQKVGGGTIFSPSSSPPASPGGGGGGGAGGALAQENGVEEEEEEVEEETFQVLHTFPFTSDRKRSSVVVRKPGAGAEGVVVYCKGADNVVLERLDPEKNPAELVSAVEENIAEFTRDGEHAKVHLAPESGVHVRPALLSSYLWTGGETNEGGKNKRQPEAKKGFENGKQEIRELYRE